MKVITNSVPRFTIDAYELTAREREQFDYYDWAAIDEGRDSATFFRYKGELHDMANFMRVQAGGELAKAGWQCIETDSAFSGTLVKYVDSERIIVGRVYS